MAYDQENGQRPLALSRGEHVSASPFIDVGRRGKAPGCTYGEEAREDDEHGSVESGVDFASDESVHDVEHRDGGVRQCSQQLSVDGVFIFPLDFGSIVSAGAFLTVPDRTHRSEIHGEQPRQVRAGAIPTRHVGWIGGHGVLLLHVCHARGRGIANQRGDVDEGWVFGRQEHPLEPVEPVLGRPEHRGEVEEEAEEADEGASAEEKHHTGPGGLVRWVGVVGMELTIGLLHR